MYTLMTTPQPNELASKVESDPRLLSHPTDCPGYCCSDFLNVKVNSQPEDWKRPDLANPIHPLFRREKFTNLSNEEYTSIELTLRLASRLLLDYRTLHYVFTVSTGTNHYDHARDAPPGPPLQIYEIADTEIRQGMPPGSMRLLRYPDWNIINKRPGHEKWYIRMRGEGILLGLVPLLTRITVVETAVNGAQATTISEVAPTYFHHSHPRGEKHNITVDPTLFWAFRSEEEGRDHMILWHRFNVARTLVHEIAHLVNSSASTGRLQEFFCENNCWNEAGYELERRLLGGDHLIQNHVVAYTEHDTWYEYDKSFVRFELPNKVRWDDSYQGGAPVDFKMFDQRWELDEWAIHRRVPVAFIAGMFTESFWTDEVPLMPESGPIQPSQTISWLFKKGLRGEQYYDSAGVQQTISGLPWCWVACSGKDPSLPPAVQQALRNINGTEMDFRRILHQGRAIYADLDGDIILHGPPMSLPYIQWVLEINERYQRTGIDDREIIEDDGRIINPKTFQL